MKLFTKSSQNGKPSKIAHPSNPYFPSIRAWDDVNHFAIARMKRSDTFAMIFAVLAILGFGGTVYYANQPRLIPYVVHTDKLNQQLAVVRAERLSATNTDPAVVRAEVRTFLFNLRSVTFDPVFQKNMIHNGVRPFVGPGSQAESTIATFYALHDPFKRAQQTSVEVAVDSPVPMSPTTYQVDWTERTRNIRGEDVGPDNSPASASQSLTHWRAFVTVGIKISGDEATIIANPAGVYVTNLQWSQVQA